MLLVIVGGIFVYRMTSKDEAPPRDFAELELAADDAEHTGTCYSLSTVLIANGVYGQVPRSWSRPNERQEDRWTLRLENVVQAPNGPVREFQDFTFEKVGPQVRLVSVDASAGYPTDVAENIDRLLAAPHRRRSTPVDRCLEDGGTGYRFTPARK
jgi:hypothetical protein